MTNSHLPPPPEPPFSFCRHRLIQRLSKLDERWQLKRMEGCSYRFSFADGDREITLAHLLGAELSIVQSVRRQASNEMCWLAMELAELRKQEVTLEAMRVSKGATPELLRTIYNVERGMQSVKGSRGIAQAFYALAGDLQKLVIPSTAIS